MWITPDSSTNVGQTEPHPSLTQSVAIMDMYWGADEPDLYSFDDGEPIGEDDT